MILSNSGGGLVHFRKEVLAAIASKGEVVAVVPKSEFDGDLTAVGCRLIPIAVDRRGTNPLSDYKLYRSYVKLIKKEKPDIVLTYTIKPNVYGGRAARKTKTPYIANVTGLGTSIENGGMLSRLTLFLYKNGLKKASCVFFQNARNKDFFEKKGVVKNGARLIPGSGVNLEKHAFEEYPPEDGGLRFLFVGRIMRDKGIGELLEAIKTVHEKHPEIRLDIIGGFDGNYQEAMDEAAKTGYIFYHGKQKDVHSFYKNAHCTVLPSYHEGMANVLLESSSTGRPVIATNVPGCAETFEEGKTGFGCAAKNTESLVEAFEKFIALSAEQRKEMGVAAREKVRREFDRQIIIDAYGEEIEKAINTDHTGRK